MFGHHHSHPEHSQRKAGSCGKRKLRYASGVAIAAGAYVGYLVIFAGDSPFVTLDVSDTAVVAMAVASEDGHLAIADAEGTLSVWDLRNYELRWRTNTDAYVQSLAFSPDASVLAAGGTSGEVALWDLVTGARTRVLRAHDNAVMDVLYSPDGRVLATLASNGMVKTWSCETWELQATCEIGLDVLTRGLAFAPVGAVVATATYYEENPRLWNAVTGELILEFGGHEPGRAYSSVAFAPNGSLLATGSWRWELVLWDVDRGRPRSILRPYSGPVGCLAFSSDSRLLASGQRQGPRWARCTVGIWDVTTGRVWRAFALPRREGSAQSCGIVDVSFIHNNKCLISAHGDGKVRVWQATR